MLTRTQTGVNWQKSVFVNSCITLWIQWVNLQNRTTGPVTYNVAYIKKCKSGKPGVSIESKPGEDFFVSAPQHIIK